MKENKIVLGIFSTYIPRQDGIATFTRDLVEALKKVGKFEFKIIAISDRPGYRYPPEVIKQIREIIKKDYRRAAKFFNKSSVDLVLIEHEYGIFGGFNGRFLLEFLKNLKKPSMIFLHTVSMAPRAKRKQSRMKLMRKVFSYVDRIGVTIPSAIEFFKSENFVEAARKMVVLPHGAPEMKDFSLAGELELRQKYGLERNDFVLTTYGLISPKKGINYMIMALSLLKKEGISAKYIIAGRMHPKKPIKYYYGLKRLAGRLKLERDILFLDRYLREEEIFEILKITNVYVTPYWVPEQVSSGTLTWAMMAGKCILTTPFAFAEDVLKDRAVFVSYKEPKELAEKIKDLSLHPEKVKLLEEKIKILARSLGWGAVARKYLPVFRKLQDK